MLRLLIASVVALSVCSAVSHNAVRQDVLDRRIQKKVSSKVGSDWGDVASGYEDVGNAIKDVDDDVVEAAKVVGDWIKQQARVWLALICSVGHRAHRATLALALALSLSLSLSLFYSSRSATCARISARWSGTRLRP